MGLDVEEAGSVAEALARALAVADPDDLVLVSGSLYVVGAARAALGAGR
jgi:folylpolyglutamate synthase/dihydropteroate synthase